MNRKAEGPRAAYGFLSSKPLISSLYHLPASKEQSIIVQEGSKIKSLTVYDGAHGIGGDKIYLEEKGKGVILDFSKKFIKYGLFYEESLKNRDTRGIHDLMYLDLLDSESVMEDQEMQEEIPSEAD